MSQKRGISETAFYILVGTIALFLASLPYLYGAMKTPENSVYTGLTYNIDDTTVYLSWMRQVENGHLFQRNQFAVEPQRGMMLNSFGLLLGGTAWLTHLPLIAIYHFYRVLFGALLLLAVTFLLREVIIDSRARRYAFLLVCLASGIGWMFGGYNSDLGWEQPIDLWQTEAITFLSLYYTPLFTSAQALMVVFFLSALRFERSGKLKDISGAAIAGALLGNFHTYDVIPLFGAWIAYRIVSDAVARKLSLQLWLGLILAGIATIPTLAYQYFALIQDPIFKARDVTTKSPLFHWILAGYGLLIPLAIASGFAKGAIATLKDDAAKRLLFTWMIVGISAAYLPVEFNRKLLMGVHIPLCCLAGATLAGLTEKLSGKMPAIVAGFTVLLTMPSNLLFLMQDITRLENNVGSTEVRPYLTQGEFDALEWLRKNTKAEDIVLCSPDMTSHQRFPFFPVKPYLAILIPGWSGNKVYDGHGSETPKWDVKFSEMLHFFQATNSDAQRLTYLRDHNIRYVLITNRLAAGPPKDAQGQPLYEPVPWPEREVPSWLQEKYKNADVTVYEMVPP